MSDDLQKAEIEYEKMLEVQINLGKMLQAKGAKVIQDTENDFDEKAVRMIEKGSAIERAARKAKLEYLKERNLEY